MGSCAVWPREDIDLHAGTIIVKRNLTQTDEFTLPKTDAGTDRVIYLIQPAIDALRNQAQLTRLGRQFEVEVKLREYGQSVIQPCTFVFSPQCVKRGPRTGYHYAVNSINKIWAPIIKRAGIRYRNAYQSRHTYACWSLSAGANPNFIATQMGHTDAQMVYKVYGKWMSEKSAEQVSSAQPCTFPLCPITAPKHGSSAVEILKFKGLAVASLHFYNMGHEMRSTLKTAYGVIGVQ